MPTTTIGNIKDLVARYMGRTTAADLTVDSFDIGLFGINAARRKVERLADLRYAEAQGDLSIAAAGTLITAVTGLTSGASVKRIQSVNLPIAGGDYIPIEFLTEDEWTSRVRRAIGRTAYSAAATLAGLGVTQTNPLAYQRGQTIFLVPAASFTFPVAAKVDVVQFMPDYTADGNTDFFTQWAPEYLQWQAILEVNKYFRRFAAKEMEATIDEKEVRAFAEEALQSLLAWNASMSIGTSTPPGTNATAE